MRGSHNFFTIHLNHVEQIVAEEFHLGDKLTPRHCEDIRNMLSEDLPELLQPINSPPFTRPWHHLINTTGPLRRQRLNRLSHADKAKELNRQVNDALDAGLVRPSRSEFGSAILFSRKADGSLRLCIEHRGLNEATRKDAYSLPHAEDTLDELKDANSYPHLDLAFGKFEF
jgi:hypothetical protein